MNGNTNHRKIYVVLIICIGTIISVWLLKQTPEKMVVTENKQENLSDDLSTRPYIETEEGDLWKNILTKVDTKNESVVNITNTNENVFDETSLTAQISRDFFSQYLIAKEGGRTLTEEELSTIVDNVASSPQYNDSLGAVYVTANLKVKELSGALDIQEYSKVVNLILKKRSEEIRDNPVEVLAEAISKNDETILKKLDPAILSGRNTISDLLKVDVPKGAVGAHLTLLNATSNVLKNLEDARQIFVDPIKGFAGMSKFSKNMTAFRTATQNINLNFSTN